MTKIILHRNQNRLYSVLGQTLRMIALLASLFLTGTSLAQSGAVAGPDSSFQIYILMGQSNMAGRGYLTKQSKATHSSRVLVLDRDMSWTTARNPLHYEKPGIDGVGPGLSFGMQMLKNAPDSGVRIGLVPCAVGGSPIEHWKAGAYDKATGTYPYDDAVKRIRKAMQSGVIAGVLWHQGESDCKDSLARNYLPQLHKLIANIRKVTANPHLPFVAGELGQFYGPHDMINTPLDALAEHLSDVGVVSSAGLTDRGDALHFDAVSAETLGKRYAAKMKAVQAAAACSKEKADDTLTLHPNTSLLKRRYLGSLKGSLASVRKWAYDIDHDVFAPSGAVTYNRQEKMTPESHWPGRPAAFAQQTGVIDVQVEAATGKYTILSSSTGWSFAGTVGSPLSDVTTTSGNDEAGSYNKTSFKWDGGSKQGSIRWYNNAPVILFELNLPNGQTGPLAGFPSFSNMPAGMHPFSYHDDHFSWPEFQLNETSTPWLLFDDNGRSCVISPASHFMVAKMKGDGKTSITSTVNEEISSYPSGFSYTTIMVLDNGIRASWDDWGTALRALYHRDFPDKDQDPLLKYYGYWTDNGADYYYNYDTNLGYEQTLLNLKQHYVDNGIPLGYMQLDSWWYEKSNYSATGVQGPGYKNANLPRGAWNLYGGLMEYVADNFVFPDGLAGFQGKLGIPLATHNRWIDPRSLYNQQYNVSGIMSPDPAFWKNIMDYLKAGGVSCYEQDWLDYIYRGSAEMQNTLSAGEQFTDEMAGAAKTNGINLQYCMAMPRYFLQGLKYNNLTTIRTSDDRFKNNKWFKFLFTSQLAYETGAMPWSDVFKSTEMGNMVFSVLSAGPVGTGDGIGKESKNNILMACRADGQIVRPDVPILPLDQSYLSMAAGDGKPVLGSTYTYTQSGDITTHYLYAFCDETHTVRRFSVKPQELQMTGEVAIYNPIAKKIKIQAATADFSDEVSADDFNYYILAPVTSAGIAFLGDAGKIAATGAKRILAIQPMGKQLKVTVQFAQGESAVVLQGYCAAYVQADKGDVQTDAATHVFSVSVEKPAGTDQVSVILTPAEPVSPPPGSFATTWKTNNTGGSPTDISFIAQGDNFSIQWQDIFDPANTGNATGVNGLNTVDLQRAGTYLVSITPAGGSFTGFQIGTAAPEKLLSIEQWGTTNWTSFANAFSGAVNLTLNAADTPRLTHVTNMSGAFRNCSGITTNAAMANWHTGRVTDMSNLFNGATHFNQSIADWDVAGVTNLNSSFKGCADFNQPVANWNTAKVTNMSNLFNGALSFNQPIGSWNVSKVENIGHVLQSARSFDQDLSAWDVSGATNMAFMFYDARSFNSDISNWNTARVSNMVSLLNTAKAFNQNLGKWNLSSVAPAKNNDGSLVSMLSNSAMDCSNYSQTLKGWADNVNTPADLTLGVTNLSYDEDYSSGSRETLTGDKHWTITGDALGHCAVSESTLSVSLRSFTGKMDKSMATLIWQSGVETGFDHYELEALYSSQQDVANGTVPVVKGAFVQVGHRAAAGDATTYRLSIPQKASVGYYRLKMVDKDGHFSYAPNIVTLRMVPGKALLSVYPNPAKGYVNITLSSQHKQGELQLFNAAGHLVDSRPVSPGINKIDLGRLPAGIYFAALKGSEERIKIIKR